MKTALLRSLAGASVLLGTACGPPPAAQSDPDSAAVVVVPPPPTASAAPEDPPEGAPEPIPSRPASAGGNVDDCIARLRDAAGSTDPAKAGGEADYRDALGAERSGSLDRARRGFLKVIQNNPQSALVPATYFAFGEMFMGEAAADPSKLALAEQAYREVLKYPAPENTFNAAAQYRLGLVHLRKDPQQALASLSRAAKADQGPQKNGCAAEVAEAALTTSVPVFADLGEPSKCWSFYLSLTGDGQRAAQRTMELSEQYVSLKKGPEAAACLASSVQSGAASHKDEKARDAYCARAKAVVAGVRAVSSAPAGTLVKQMTAACP